MNNFIKRLMSRSTWETFMVFSPEIEAKAKLGGEADVSLLKSESGFHSSLRPYLTIPRIKKVFDHQKMQELGSGVVCQVDNVFDLQ